MVYKGEERQKVGGLKKEEKRSILKKKQAERE